MYISCTGTTKSYLEMESMESGADGEGEFTLLLCLCGHAQKAIFLWQ